MMRSSLVCVALLAMPLARAATVYHVALTGKDSNPGTLASPLRTIQHGCNLGKAGDTVLVHSGRYQERVVLKSSITLSNAPGEHPVIDGTGLAVTTDHGLVYIANLSNVIVQGFEIANYRTTDSNVLPCGIYVEGKGDKISLKSNLIHNIENNGSDAASINAFGIVVYGNSPTGKITHLLIDGNEIHDTKTGNSETLTVNGNVDGFEVSRNYVHNVNNIGIDAIGFEGTSPIPGQDQARNGVIEGNVVEGVTSAKNPSYFGQRSADGIYVDGGANIIVQRNLIRICDLGMEVTSEHLGKVASNVIVRNNLLYGNLVVGISIGGYDVNRGGTTNCTFVNNTLVGNDTTHSGSGEFQIQFHTSGNVLKNNLLNASAQGVLISSLTGAGSAVGLTSDYNLFYTTGIPGWVWDGQTYSSLSQFRKGAGQDSHSLFQSPMFVSLALRNYQLALGSPAINAGVNLGATIVGTVDRIGHARVLGSGIDIGCYEFAAPKP